MKITTNIELRITAAVLLAAAAANATSGQRPEPPPTNREAMNRELLERSRALDTLEKTVRTPPPEHRPGPRLDLTRVEEDHLRIQQAANGLHQAAAQGNALDLKAVAKSASEIRERAVRLGSALALPKPEKEDKRPKPAAIADAEGLRGALAALHELIYRFARSPVFTEVNLVDAEQSAKARRDLDEIIGLSERVKKGCQELEKGGKK
ncbi:MAG TPA: hypothetical protein VFH01_10370 [Pyrinomonadaceae bacterium]|nr:hypothetical protein [Pyrinomonadaceae bacterium]